jgi:hypothetical protein
MTKVALKSVGRNLDAEDVVWDGLKTAGAFVRLLSEVQNPDVEDMRLAMAHIGTMLEAAQDRFKVIEGLLEHAYPAPSSLETAHNAADLKPTNRVKKRKAKASKATGGVAST